MAIKIKYLCLTIDVKQKFLMANFKKTTGEILRESREKQGLLLRQVSASLNIDTAILSKVERGERKATREQILKIADILGLNKDELLINYLSEKIAYQLIDEDVADKTLRVAEQKVKYLKANKKNGH